MKKRILSVLLSMVLILGLLPTASFAADTEYTPTRAELSAQEIGSCTFNEVDYKIYRYTVDTTQYDTLKFAIATNGAINPTNAPVVGQKNSGAVVTLAKDSDDFKNGQALYNSASSSFSDETKQKLDEKADQTCFYWYTNSWKGVTEVYGLLIIEWPEKAAEPETPEGPYEINYDTITSNTTAGTLDEKNVYLISIPSQYTSFIINANNDQSALSGDSFTSQSYYSVGNNEIDRSNGYYTAVSGYYNSKKDQISGFTPAANTDYLLCRLLGFDEEAFDDVPLGYVLIAWEKAAEPEKKTATVDLLASGLAEGTYDSTYSGSISIPNNKTFSGTTYIKTVDDAGAALEYTNSTQKNIGLKYTGLLTSPTAGFNGLSVSASDLTGIAVTGSDLVNAGFPEDSLKSGYDYYFIVIFCSQLKKSGKPIGDDYAVLVQIKKAASDVPDVPTDVVITLNKDGLAADTYNDTYDNTGDSTAEIKTYNKASFRGITYIVTIDNTKAAVQFAQSIGLVAAKNYSYLLAKGSGWSSAKTKEASADGIQVTAEELQSAGFPAEKLKNDYNYYFIAMFCSQIKQSGAAVGDDYAVLVQVKKPAGLSEEEKKPLRDLLATVEDGQTLYYTEGDRYNGVAADTVTETDGGLWKNFTAEKGPRETARKLLETATGTEQITAGVAALQAEIDKLIPTSRINATKIYEAVNKYEHTYYERDEDRPGNSGGYKSGYLLSDYTEVSANAYRAALAEAKAYLARLFDENGQPTKENIAKNQGTADGYADALIAAVKELAATWDPYSTRALAFDAIPELCRLADAAAGNDDVTAAARAALKTARDEAKAIWDAQSGEKENLKYSQYAAMVAAYRKLFDAYYIGLENDVPSVTVKVRVADTASVKPSKYGYFKGEWSAVTWSGEITLTSDQTLGGLEKALGSKLYYAGRDDGFGAASYLFLINGVYPNSLRSSFSSYFSDHDYSENTYYSDRYTLHDGDTVELFLVPTPTVPSYVGYNNLYATDAIRFIQRARFEQEGQEVTVLSVDEGEEIKLHVTRAYAALPTYTGEYTAFAGAKLFTSPEGSGAELSEENYGEAAAPTVDSGLVTDENGDVTVTLYGPGWVHLYAVDTSADKGFYGATSVANEKKIEALPCMTTGASVWVHVRAKTGEELQAGLEQLIARLDESYENLERIRLTAAELETVDADYAARRAAIAAAESLTEGNRQLQAFLENLQKLLDGHADSAQGLESVLAYLPDDVKDFTKGFQTRFEYAKALAESLTTYQYQQLSVTQKEKYERLLAAYGEDGSSLPPEVDPTVTVKIVAGQEYQEDFIVANNRSYPYVPADYANEDVRVNVPLADAKVVRTSAALGAFDGADGYRLQEGAGYQLIIARKLPGKVVECEYNAKVAKIEVVDENGDPIPVVRIQTPNYTESNTDSSRMRFFYDPATSNGFDSNGEYGMKAAIVDFGCIMPRNIIVKVYLEKADAPDPILAIRAAASEALERELSRYEHKDYSETNWAQLLKSYNAGQEGIHQAETEEEVLAAKNNAVTAMQAVEKDMTGRLGQVHVTVENTLFPQDQWPEGTTYWAGTLVDEWIDLQTDDTMMSCIVRALTENNCQQTGAETNYISSISDSQGNKLGETDGGGESGWMGTLNGWFTYKGFGEFTVANGWLSGGDEIRVMYTVQGLGEDLGSISSQRPGGQNTTLKGLTVTGGTLREAFQPGSVGSSNEYTLQISGESGEILLSPEAANKNYLTRIFLNAKVTADFEPSNAPVSYYKNTWAIPVKVGDKIYVGCGEKGWPTMNNNTSVGEVQTSSGTWYVLTVSGGAEDDGSAAVISLIRKNCLPLPAQDSYKDRIDAVSKAREAYEALSPEAKIKVSNYQTLVDAESAIQSFQKTDGLKESIARLPLVNRATLSDEEAVLAAKAVYDTLTPAEKDRLTYYESNKLSELVSRMQELRRAADQAAADKAAEKINAIGEVTKESGAAIDEARKAYDDLNEEQRKFLPEGALEKLEKAEQDYKDLPNKEAAAKAAEKINAIGEVTKESGVAIDEARKAYDALNEEQRKFLPEGALEKLEKAERDYRTLLDQEAADKVAEKINAIGEVTKESGAAIDEARKAYDALNEEQRKFLPEGALKKLEKAEEDYRELPNKEAAAKVDEKIEAIGDVTAGSGKRIREAREAYDALTEPQKKYVEKYEQLVRAENRYRELTDVDVPGKPEQPTQPTQPTEPAEKELPFADVKKGDWFYAGVKYAYEAGLMKGVSETEFRAGANTTRGMIVTILARMEGVDTAAGETWYSAGREWAMRSGISDGTNMDGSITREQLAAMLYRYAKLKGYDVSASAVLSGYSDASQVSDWAQEAMQWAVGTGLIQGSGNALNPQATATRGQIATILMRFSQSVVK